MARQLRWWIGAALLVCVAVALIYLPPRAAPLFTRRFQLLEPTPYRLRVQELADAWRAAALELRLRQYRERLRPELNRRRALETPGPAVLLDWPDASDSLRRVFAAKLEADWRHLGLEVSKVSVAVVLALDRAATDTIQPSQQGGSLAFLLPDSSDRATCVVLQTAPTIKWLRGTVNLGPCAFYAAFGAPGRDIGRWLSARDFDLAIAPLWTRNRPSRGGGWLLERDQPWFWWEVYHHQPDGVACLAGRPSRCRSAVVDPRQPAGEPAHLVTVDQRWFRRPPALAGGTHYLADVVRSVGRERFRRFWNSELPVDTALAEALRMPVGEWTRRWQADLVPPIPLGPAPAAGPTLLGFLLAAAALGLVLRTVRHREVR
jgi:hypothetical protein